MRDSVGPFSQGVDNRRSATDLTLTVERSRVELLRAAVNVDVMPQGLRRRDGYALAQEGAFHSLWGDGGAYGFAVRGTQLLAIDAAGSLQVVREGMAEGVPVSFDRRAGLVYWVDGMRLGAVDGVQVALAAPQAPPPAARVVDGGALHAGQYQLVMTYSGMLGEGPASELVVLEVPAGGAIHLDGLQAPDGLQVTVYMTGANGSVFNAVDLVRFEDSARIATQEDAGAQAQTIGLDAMPSGAIVRSHKDRLLVARGNVLYYSEPFAPLLTRLHSHFVHFSDRITLVRPCAEGVYVCADKTYWLPGDIAQAPLMEVLPYGAVPGTDVADVSRSGTVYWMSERGLVRALGSGQAVNVQEQRLAIAGGLRGAAYLRERNGQAHVIASTQSPEVTKAAANASFDAELIKKGFL